MELSSLKAKHTSFPVESLIDIYLLAQSPLYTDYFSGLAMLTKWLSPIAPIASYNIPDYSASILAKNYYISEAAKHLSGEAYGSRYNRYRNLIIHKAILCHKN